MGVVFLHIICAITPDVFMSRLKAKLRAMKQKYTDVALYLTEAHVCVTVTHMDSRRGNICIVMEVKSVSQ